MKNIILAVFLLMQRYCFATTTAVTLTTDLEICSIYDFNCHISNYVKFAMDVGPKGIPGVMEPTMPLKLSNVEALVLGVVKLKLKDGQCQGINTCTISKFETDWDNLRRKMDIICQKVVIEGNYEISTDPNFISIIGNANGSGHGSLTIEDWLLSLDIPFYLKKDENAHVFLLPQFNETNWISDIRKKVSVTADNIKVNEKNVTKSILKYLNKTWKSVLATFGQFIHDISWKYYTTIIYSIYENLPVSPYYKEDLTPFIKNGPECYQ